MMAPAIKTTQKRGMYFFQEPIQFRVGLRSQSEELYTEAESKKNRFFRAVASYERFADAKYRTEITFQGSLHTWDEVLDEVDRVACQYRDVSGFWAKIRIGLRKFGENHSAFDAWIGLLPAQSLYCSILCGGLKLVIQVCSFRVTAVEFAK